MYAIACVCVFAISIISSKQFPQKSASDASDELKSESQKRLKVGEIKSPVSPIDSDKKIQDVSQREQSDFKQIKHILPQNSNETHVNLGFNDLVDRQDNYPATDDFSNEEYSKDKNSISGDKKHSKPKQTTNKKKIEVNNYSSMATYEDDSVSNEKFMPQATDFLDRNKPEPGFDITRAEIKKFKLWPDAQIPYFIDTFSFSDKVLRDKIRSFLSSVNSLTSLSFVELPSPPSDNSRWVFFINRRGLLGCADHSIKDFTNEGVQHVVLGYHCLSTEGELAEAVLAIAGVPPQHNAPNRDDYIQIKEDNIMPEKKYLFQKLSDDEWLFHDLEYDFESAGHYNSHKYSVNGRATIEPQKKVRGIVIGESKVLTPYDIQKIRMLYNFIAKKRLLQAPDCHKLFEPGKNFKDFEVTDKQTVPRPKPYQYTGKDPKDISLNIGENEDDQQKDQQKSNEQDENGPIIEDNIIVGQDTSQNAQRKPQLYHEYNYDHYGPNIEDYGTELTSISFGYYHSHRLKEDNNDDPGPNVLDQANQKGGEEYDDLSEFGGKGMVEIRPNAIRETMKKKNRPSILSMLSDYPTDYK